MDRNAKLLMCLFSYFLTTNAVHPGLANLKNKLRRAYVHCEIGKINIKKTIGSIHNEIKIAIKYNLKNGEFGLTKEQTKKALLNGDPFLHIKLDGSFKPKHIAYFEEKLDIFFNTQAQKYIKAKLVKIFIFEVLIEFFTINQNYVENFLSSLEEAEKETEEELSFIETIQNSFALLKIKTA